MTDRVGGFLCGRKVFNGHLPSFSGNHLPLYWLLRTSVREKDLLGFHHPPLSLYQVVVCQRSRRAMFLMQRLQERSAKDRFRHDATSWMHLVHRLASRTRGPASGCPAVLMVQPTHDRKSDHFAPCILRGRNRSAPFRNLLLNPLVRSSPVELHHILIEHALELLLPDDQRRVQACLSEAPQIACPYRIVYA